MSKDCLVTKLKGTVDNPNLKFFGEMTLNLADVGNVGLQNGTIIAGDEPFNYVFTGVTLSNPGLPMTGTVAANGRLEFTYTGNGTLKLWSKYGLTAVQCNRGINCDPEAVYFLPCGFGNTGINVWDHIDNEVKIVSFGEWGYNVPLIKDNDYSKLNLDSLEGLGANASVRLNYPPDSPRYYGLNSAALQSLLNAVVSRGLADKVSGLGLWEPDSVVDATTLSNFVNIINISVHRLTFTGDIVNSLKPLTKLEYLNLQTADPTETSLLFDITPVLNAWAAAGKEGTCNLWVNANYTYNGVTQRLEYNTNITFSSGSWAPVA